MADSEQASAAPGTAAPESLGQLLRSARLAQDLTLEQLATELRIEAKQLNALEENRFERIGVPVFIKGYLRQYGTRLGLDVADLLALYYKQTTLGEVEIQPSRTIKLHDERQITSWAVAAVILLAVIAALAVWWWNGGGLDAPRTSSASAPASAPASGAPAAEPQRAAEAPVAGPAPTEPAASEAPAPAEQDARAAAAESQPPAAAVVGADVAGAADAARAPAPAGDERAAPVIAIPLEFTFDAESWAEVSDARGERLLFGLIAAGRRVTVRGEPPFAVVLGNAPGVRLVVDGEPFAIPTTGRQGDLARFSVDIAEE